MGCGASASHTPQAPHQEGSPVVPFNSDTSSSAQTEKKAVPMAAFRQEEGSTKVKLLSPQPTPVHLSRQKRSRGSVACYLSQNTIVNGVLARPPDEVLPYLADPAVQKAIAKEHFDQFQQQDLISKASLLRVFGIIYAARGVDYEDEAVKKWLEMSLVSLGAEANSEDVYLTWEEFQVIHACCTVFANAKAQELEHRKSACTPLGWSKAGRSRFDRHVFLGGSCDPTTWRQDEAIPALKKAAVSFYNPQTLHWHPGLIDDEAKAKDQCHVLLFVIDSVTRSISSMLEVCEYMMRGRPVFLVLHNIEEGTQIDGQQVSGRALRDLNRARAFLKDIALRHKENVSVYTSIAEAVQQLCKMPCIQCQVPLKARQATLRHF